MVPPNDRNPLWELEAWCHRLAAMPAAPSKESSGTVAGWLNTLVCALRAARRAVFLFPHHDTITGTSQVRLLNKYWRTRNLHH